MLVTKEISKDNELHLYFNGKIIYKRWLDTGQSKVFDVMAYDKYTHISYKDLDIQDSPSLITVKVKIKFYTKEKGGRSSGIMSGYRPNHVFEYNEDGEIKEAFLGDIQFNEQEILELGEYYQVNIRFAAFQRIERFLNKGRIWWIHEGPLKIGQAEILEIEIPKFSNQTK